MPFALPKFPLDEDSLWFGLVKKALHTAQAAATQSLRLTLAQQIQDNICLARQAQETGRTHLNGAGDR